TNPRRLAPKGRLPDMRETEVYELVCGECGNRVEFAAGPSRTCELAQCPRCTAALRIAWRPDTEPGKGSSET
ncbi:MAG TPA: hypothetical protein VM120_05355, partial [Bryobacteraceae bacterium]|nr:hypothetical protein [Bryobacteraceae bacterium]